MRPYILCQGAARDVFGGLDVATDEAASVVLKIQNGSLNEEAVVPKDDEKDDDDNEEEYNGTVHPAFEPKQSAATRARHRTDMTVALSLGVDLNSMDAQHMNCTPASLLLPDEEIHDEEDNATPKAPPMSFAGLAHCQIVDMNKEAVLPKDDEKDDDDDDDDDNEDEYNGVAHPAFEPKQSPATRARHRTDMTVALPLSKGRKIIEIP